MAESSPEAIRRLRELIDAARRCVVFTGAGISTESGIPDFRSPGGLWTKMKPIQFEDFVSSAEARRESWRRRFDRAIGFEAAEPNRGHRAIAHLVRTGKVSHVITQNIDGLHARSGVPEELIIELHGNNIYAKCIDCGERYELAPIRTAFETAGILPECGSCGGHVKTATVSFGQPMPEDAMRRAEAATLACDLFISVGSSLVVYPAAGFPILAKRNGAKLVILNRDPTDLDSFADMLLNFEIGPTLGPATGVN
jgi:NAD-dependent protein deacetylase/lipoamidase